MAINSGSFHANDTDDRKERVTKFARRNGALLVVAFLALCTFLFTNGITDGRANALASQHAQILSLEKAVADAEFTVAKDYGEAVLTASGVSAEHKATDDEVVRQLLEKSLTWDGLKEYLDRRDEVMNEFGFSEDSDFMTVFLPGQDQGVIRTAPSGKTYAAFDKDMASRFESMTSYVTEVSADVYSYFTIAGMRTSSASGRASVLNYSVLSYDVIDGELANVDAWTAPGGVERSG